jgi:hypothetical protein
MTTKIDYRQTISLDKTAYDLIHQMADDIGGSVSSTLRQVIREAYAIKQREAKREAARQ